MPTARFLFGQNELKKLRSNVIKIGGAVAGLTDRSDHFSVSNSGKILRFQEYCDNKFNLKGVK